MVNVLTAIAATVAAILSAWAKLQSAATRRRSIRASMAARTAEIQLNAWRLLLAEHEELLARCQASEQKMRIDLSATRTKIVALEKVVLGEYPHDLAVQILRGEQLGR